MNKHKRKMIAPIVITALAIILIILNCVGFAALVFVLKLPTYVGMIGMVVPLAIATTVLGLCIQRIKEIRSGEEDDLGKY